MPPAQGFWYQLSVDLICVGDYLRNGLAEQIWPRLDASNERPAKYKIELLLVGPGLLDIINVALKIWRNPVKNLRTKDRR